MNDSWPEGRDFPFGIHASHNWNELGAIFRVIDDFDIRTFVELGVFKGGLASMMIARSRNSPDFYYLGIEKDFNLADPIVQDHLWDGDVFDDVIVDKLLEQLLHWPIPQIIYCDNGDKPREVKTYLPVVPSGTYIMAHDWGTEITSHDLDMLDPKLYVRHFPEYFEGTRLLLLEAV